MNKLFLCIFSILVFTSSDAQKTYEVLTDTSDDNPKMLRGIITKEDISNDPSFKWYAESQKIYPHPDSTLVAAFKNNKDKIYFLIFGGTWCEDTHFILPKFYKTQEVSGFPEDRIMVFAVDRKKKAIGDIAQAMNIKNTPTIIVMKDGEELGRLIEYGKSGYWDKELADIINERSP